jgi:hypothetical protein
MVRMRDECNVFPGHCAMEIEEVQEYFVDI